MNAGQQAQGLKQAHKIEEFPIKDEQRMCTDVFCTITTVLFTLSTIITSLIVFNSDHYVRTSFPSDSQGRVCGYDLPSHPFVYLTNLPSIKQRVCVAGCPGKGDARLNCVPTESIGCIFSSTPHFSVAYYQSQAQSLQIGSFCVPTSQALKQQLYEDIDVTNRYHFFTQIKSIVICGLIAFAISIIYLCLVQIIPKLMNYLSVIVGLVFLTVTALFILFYPSENVLYRVIFGVLLLVLVGVVGFSAFKSSACFDMHGVFLAYSSQLLRQELKLLIYIPIFLVLFTLFIMMIVWQLKCLWSCSRIQFSQQDAYYRLEGGSTTFMTVLVSFQFIWGLSFIKQSFNFCISGNALGWYDNQLEREPSKSNVFKPLFYLLRYHLGSVAAASFMSLLFSILDYIFDLLRTDGTHQHSCLQLFDSFFDLVRSDSLAYINLSGNPYCNASRYCEKLCRKSPIAESYRICSHLLLAGIVSTVSFFLQEGKVSIFIVLVVFLLSLFASTFFISLHADAAEAIQILFLLDYQFAKHSEKDVLKHDLHQLQLRNNVIAEQYHRQAQKLKARAANK